VRALAAEAIGTVALVFAGAIMVDAQTHALGHPVGGAVGLDATFGGPVTGASMSPARSLGPALVSGDLHALPLYIAAPPAGAAAGALAYQLVRGGSAGGRVEDAA